LVTASDHAQSGVPGALRRPALLAVAALFSVAVPVAAQDDTDRLTAPTPPRLDTPHEPGMRDFWERLGDEARRFRELNGGPLAFARRYRISPDLARTIHRVAEETGIDPDLAFRLVRAESNFNPRARSRAGALGLTQLMPATARWLDPQMTTPARIMEPERNLRVGLRYLRQLIDRYDGDLRLALLAYNRGHGTVDRALRSGRDPENGYTRMVLGRGVNRYAGTPVQTR
jgi:soluble lytic murein transglycosylase-like protein